MQPPPPIPRAAAPRRADWMERNFKWFVPAFCLVLLAGFFGLIILVSWLLKQSTPYSETLAMVKSSAAITENLGAPIKDGWMSSVNISETGSSGSARITMHVSGPKGTAQIEAVETRSFGEWHYIKLVARIDSTGAIIDLLETNSPSAIRH